MDYLIFISVVVIIVFSMRFFMMKKARKNMGKEVDVSLFDSTTAKMLSKNKSIIYFYTPTCGNCKVQAPIIDKLGEELNDVSKIDLTQRPALSSEFGILGVPTIAIMKGNRIANVFVGRQSESVLRTAFNKA